MKNQVFYIHKYHGTTKETEEKGKEKEKCKRDFPKSAEFACLTTNLALVYTRIRSLTAI